MSQRGKNCVSLMFGKKRDVLCHLSEGKSVEAVPAEFSISVRQVYEIEVMRTSGKETARTAEVDHIMQRPRRQRSPLVRPVDGRCSVHMAI